MNDASTSWPHRPVAPVALPSDVDCCESSRAVPGAAPAEVQDVCPIRLSASSVLSTDLVGLPVPISPAATTWQPTATAANATAKTTPSPTPRKRALPARLPPAEQRIGHLYQLPPKLPVSLLCSLSITLSLYEPPSSSSRSLSKLLLPPLPLAAPIAPVSGGHSQQQQWLSPPPQSALLSSTTAGCPPQERPTEREQDREGRETPHENNDPMLIVT